MIRFLENIGEYFSTNYFDEDFAKKVLEESKHSKETLNEFKQSISKLKEKYYSFKQQIIENRLRTKDKILETHKFHTLLLDALGYDGKHNGYHTPFQITEKEVIPIRHILRKGASNKIDLMVLEIQPMIRVEIDKPPDGLFQQSYDSEEPSSEQKYHRSQWKEVFKIEKGLKVSPMVVNQCISKIALLDKLERPRFILVLAGNKLFLIEPEKWMRGSYLIFDIEELFSIATGRNLDLYTVFYLLLGKDTLCPEGQSLMHSLDENSHKSAYEVTQDLKEGIIHAVEKLANEYLYYQKTILNRDFDETDDTFEKEVRDDCLTIVYRLLFIFYAESRPELGILPMKDTTYLKGYSLEMLRDLEQVHLGTQDAKNGYFFHYSLYKLFNLLYQGNLEDTESFRINPIDSPLFDESKLHHLGYHPIAEASSSTPPLLQVTDNESVKLNSTKFRNFVWQDIIQKLSLSKKQRSKSRGRISYANLGINQLGSVYESLLAYRGFYAEEDYIEVHEKKNSKKGTFLVVRRRLDDFHQDEILKDNQGEFKILKKGDFVYRLSGRDRTKSASFYTPEILTKSTVKYTLRPILEKVENQEVKAQDILHLKILEPAMGAAAFLNEVIHQLAETYIQTRQKETNKTVAPQNYRKELHIIKAYIATNNSYGVDLNPTAIELGKLSIWLNIIHKGMQPPFFGSRLGIGNAVIGAWFKTFSTSQLRKRKWWEYNPQMIEFNNGRIIRDQDHIYHFLLPDDNMVPSKNIQLLKKEFPSEAKYITQWKKENRKPINNDELDKLRAICKKIDALLIEHYSYQMESKSKTQISLDVWEMEKVYSKGKQLEIDFNEKDSINQKRNNKSSPYYKIKLLMDYWCSLWFWDLRDAYDLPSRSRWISDIQTFLELEDSIPTKYTDGNNQINWSDPKHIENLKQQSQQSHLFDEKKRIKIVYQTRDTQRFFHFQLEFIEVFMEKGGFDIIIGNPPWVRSQFEEKEVMSELYPELIIRNVSAPNTRKKREEYLQIKNQKKAYYREYIETDSTANFLGGYQNYPLLKGHISNLYKNVLTNCFGLVSQHGVIGLLHPESIYNFPGGKVLRKEMYKRLVYHFQFQNRLKLFSEVASNTIFGINVYNGGYKEPNFISMNNIIHPSTIDGSLVHQGMGNCYGEKFFNPQTNTFERTIQPHKSRVINITSKELKIIAKTFENSDDWESCRLVRIHSEDLLKVTDKIGDFETILRGVDNKIDTCWNETLSVKEGYIKRKTQYPSYKNFEFILSGPHVGVSNPLYKNPRKNCKSKGDYDSIELMEISNDFFARTNYIPNVSANTFFHEFKGLKSDDSWFDYYKIAFRRMLNLRGERALIGAIYPPKSAHVNALISVVFSKNSNLTEFVGLSSSIIVDFYLRVMGAEDITPNRLSFFPLGIDVKYRTELDKRTLLLNCLNIYYTDLWENNYQPDFTTLTWSKNDNRLKSFDSLSKKWEWKTPLRNHYERRQALVEIDVIVAMAFRLTLEELIQIYLIEFSILQENEYNTYYDTCGNIVFTTSRSLKGVGVDKSDWEKIKNYQEGEIYQHTITKSEMYQGKEITYHAPFDKCDRVEDYNIAWKYFENLFSS